jgi:hypothetical protein
MCAQSYASHDDLWFLRRTRRDGDECAPWRRTHCGSNDHFCAFALSHQGQRTFLKEVGVGKLASSHMFEERKTEKKGTMDKRSCPYPITS